MAGLCLLSRRRSSLVVLPLCVARLHLPQVGGRTHAWSRWTAVTARHGSESYPSATTTDSDGDSGPGAARAGRSPSPARR